MKQEDKELLLKDLCTRLPYEVILLSQNGKVTYQTNGNTAAELLVEEGWKPYLRSMSSMTEEEKHKLLKFGAIICLRNGEVIDVSCVGFERHTDVQDYLNACHFDYRGLIPKGLAIAVTEENNPYKE